MTTDFVQASQFALIETEYTVLDMRITCITRPRLKTFHCSQTGKFAKCAKETDRLPKTCAYKF